MGMDAVRNPYAPGAGSPPPELAGRKDVIESARVSLRRLTINRPSQSPILVGLRGVGKTVLLVRIRQLAQTEQPLFTPRPTRARHFPNS
jgi:Cdc6-like AAA superfamily ATPase